MSLFLEIGADKPRGALPHRRDARTFTKSHLARMHSLLPAFVYLNNRFDGQRLSRGHRPMLAMFPSLALWVRGHAARGQ
jgi:hypothetical protein